MDSIWTRCLEWFISFSEIDIVTSFLQENAVTSSVFDELPVMGFIGLKNINRENPSEESRTS